MKTFFYVVLIVGSFVCQASAQELSTADKAVVQAAREKYYNLELHGFVSASCQVRFDLSTVPSLNEKDGEADRKGLEATHFVLHVDTRKQPYVQVVYPGGASDDAPPYYAPTAKLLKSIVTGFFQTWPSKGLNGPVPPFDSQIESVAVTDQGYSLMLHVAGTPVRLDMDKNYLATEISSLSGGVDERPVYVPSPEGLVFSGNAATDNTRQQSPTTVRYEIQSRVVDGIQFPASIRLRVNQNIDLKFALNDCSLEKATVSKVKPPQH